MKTTTLLAPLGALAVSLTLAAGTASAVPVYCSSSAILDESDVTFRTVNSDDCYGVVDGNDSLADVNSLETTGLWGDGWDTFVKDDPTPGTVEYLGFSWTLDASLGTTSGTWTLTLGDPAPPSSLPVTVDFIAVLKGSDSWAAYFFDDQTFNLLGLNSGTFEIVFLNNGKQIPNLSHMTLYLRESDGSDGSDSETPVPEPGSLVLLGSGLVLAVSRFRKKARQR